MPLYVRCMSERPRLVDIFAGAGGFSLGFEQAGFDPVGAVENDTRAGEAYMSNFRDSQVLVMDAATVTGDDLVDSFGRCDVMIAGPPCQAFSIGGRMRPDDNRRDMVAQFGRIVREIRPQCFVMENVPGILMKGARCLLSDFCNEMRNSGYVVAEPWLLHATEFGVPQLRQRVFVVGVRRGTRTPEKPKTGKTLPSSAHDALSDLETINADEVNQDGQFFGVLSATGSRYASLLRCETADEDDHSEPRPAPDGLTGCAQVPHAPEIAKRFDSVAPGSREPISRFPRLHPDRPSPTLRAGTLSDRGSHTAPRPIHYAAARCITVREAARLQSMPDWFTVDLTKHRGFMQVGNAVPVWLARAVGRSVMNVL